MSINELPPPQKNELSQSKDLIQENIETLKSLFPEIITENKIDFKVLQEILGEEIEQEEEYYRFTWTGKTKARREAHKPSTGTLRPIKEESLDWNATKNLYIEGDNLEVLKLLQKSYVRKIKMIYIDPPYNTGKDFVYKDDYKDNLKNYRQITGQIDSEGNKLFTNSDSDGRYHSKWLNMMYPRLILARNLLKEDGVIFISIDDNEIENLKKLCDEVFGEVNFISTIAWRRSDNQPNIGNFARVKEYIVCFAKNKEMVNLYKLPLTEKAKSKYTYRDKIGDFRRSILLDKTRGRYFYEVKTKSGNILNGPWMIDEHRFNELDKNDEIYWASGGEEQPSGKIYLHESTGQIPNDFWGIEFGTNQRGSDDIKNIFQERAFDFPKPISLLKSLIKIGSNNQEIILDFFSGSSSTAHSVIELNLEENSKRKFIQVQLPEPTNEKSQAYKAGYKRITEIGKERIRRVVKKIKEEHPIISKELDLGFKVFKLDSSNIKSWDGNPDNVETSLLDTVENIKPDRTEEDVLYEILLKSGLDLTLPIEERNIERSKVFNIGLGSLFICLADISKKSIDSITRKVAEGIGQWKKECNPEICRVVFRDNGFNDVEKTNSVQILKRYGVDEIRTI